MSKSSKKSVRSAGNTRQTWYAALGAVTSAEKEIERQVRLLLKSKKISAKEASALLKDLSSRIAKERARALKQLESRMEAVQAVVKRERKAVGRMVDEAVHGALSAFNIPSRQEVAHLTRKVDELSQKIDAFQGRRAASRKARAKSTRRGNLASAAA